MNEAERAKRWFIERFIHSSAGRSFALRANGLEPMTVDQKKKMAALRQNNTQYDFHFIETPLKIYVEPNHGDAGWVRGMIWHDPIERELRYATLKRITLFGEEDTI